jgi:peroxiredoxin Q/BCP
VVIGASTDTLEAQKQFTEKENLNYPLVADDAKKVTDAYGILGKSGFANRSTFVIDKQGVLRKAYTKVSVDSHPDEVLKFVKENLTK